jgi:DNA-binding transcriptional LysR family regulator
MMAGNPFSMVMVQSARHLEIVKALAEHKHFGRAAETLGISQPALSKGLNHLEEIIGARLFDRSGTVTPTEFGEIVLAHSDAILNGFFELQHELEMAKGLDSGTLLISAGIFAAEASGQQAMGLLLQRHPKLRCAVFVKDWASVVEDVLNRESHLGFADITNAMAHADLETELVCAEKLAVFARAGHPLSGRGSVSFEEMMQYPWVGTSLPPAWRPYLPEGERSFGVLDERGERIVPRLVVENFTAMRQVVKAGDAVSAGPLRLLTTDIANGSIVRLPVVGVEWMKSNYGFMWRRGRSLPPAALAFMEIVRSIESGFKALNAAE